MPRSSTGQQSFIKAEAALKMSPGLDIRLKLSVKKTVVLLKILYCKIIVQLIADAVDISTGSVKTILHKHLLMRKVCARWVPQMLD